MNCPKRSLPPPGLSASILWSQIEPIVADVDYRNIAQLAAGVDLILDGTDNFETRFLINDFAVRESIPWIFAGVVGAAGQTMTILPGQTACLRCLMPDSPPAGDAQTCETAGILGPAVGMIASIEASEALKILSGHREAVSRSLTVVDLWDNRLRQIDLASLRDQVDCPTCRRGEFPWLSGARADQHAVLCGRGAVQLTPPEPRDWDLAALAAPAGGRRPRKSQSLSASACRRGLSAYAVSRRSGDYFRHRRRRSGAGRLCPLYRPLKRAPLRHAPVTRMPWQLQLPSNSLSRRRSRHRGRTHSPARPESVRVPRGTAAHWPGASRSPSSRSARLFP